MLASLSLFRLAIMMANYNLFHIFYFFVFSNFMLASLSLFRLAIMMANLFHIFYFFLSF